MTEQCIHLQLIGGEIEGVVPLSCDCCASFVCVLLCVEMKFYVILFIILL